ncbi:small acid-soluble spore protein (alpha/beta-type SASP) [[Clostridium] ultunense Esp]|uniref:alpha/beta-type small acid-soluble spore protein n=1 Tax=Thermicanus aegyptius TaxID=94009 RepID=UPI0002B6FF34|nr:alpha/beta-type small acid-soluble spore protein [Thermicanus aegyptius]CCQ94791.1 small acid-soluble spore protein (alpha/beta-type SASP) [[Clostridium] ultunense Esp]
MPARNRLIVPGAEEAVQQMKIEIAAELGVELSGNTTARGNGSVGGEMTKRLVREAQSKWQQ